MRIYTATQAKQHFTDILAFAENEEVIIKRKDGVTFSLVPKKRLYRHLILKALILAFLRKKLLKRYMNQEPLKLQKAKILFEIIHTVEKNRFFKL